MPQIVLLFLAYFGLTRLTGLNLDGITASVLVFTLWGAAEMGDLVRGALISIPRHQYESAEALGLTRSEVSAVATFYSQYRRHPNGEYNVGVCTNALCAVMGGDEIWETLTSALGVGSDETTPDGKITLEALECNAGCDYAPVVMVNWEFFDNQTPTSALQIVEDIRAGRDLHPTRGADKVHTFKETERVLAGFEDGHADEGPGAGCASLRGLEIARERGWSAPKEVAK